MNNCAVTTTCKNVFKGGNTKPASENYTKLWIALINQIERNKQVLAGAR